MATETLNKIVDEQIERSTKFWAGKPRMTEEELDAGVKYAKEKTKGLEKLFDTPEKVEKIKKMIEEAKK